MDCTTEQLRAGWTVQAFKEVWLPSPLVIGVTPYALLDQPQGFQRRRGLQVPAGLRAGERIALLAAQRGQRLLDL